MIVTILYSLPFLAISDIAGHKLRSENHTEDSLGSTSSRTSLFWHKNNPNAIIRA
jgi:hypothetical protein